MAGPGSSGIAGRRSGPGADLPDDGTAGAPPGSGAGAAAWYRARVPRGLRVQASLDSGIRGLRQLHISVPAGHLTNTPQLSRG
jgi:hypothetical protein